MFLADELLLQAAREALAATDVSGPGVSVLPLAEPYGPLRLAVFGGGSGPNLAAEARKHRRFESAGDAYRVLADLTEPLAHGDALLVEPA